MKIFCFVMTLFIVFSSCIYFDTERPSGISVFAWIDFEEGAPEIEFHILKNGEYDPYDSGFSIGYDEVCDNAVVTVNGVRIPYHWDDQAYIAFDGNAPVYSNGEENLIHIEVDGQLLDQSLIMPAFPFITSHVEYENWVESVDNTLIWTLDNAEHDENEIVIYGTFTPDGIPRNLILNPDVTDCLISAGSFKDAQASLYLDLIARRKFTDFGPAFTDNSFISLNRINRHYLRTDQ